MSFLPMASASAYVNTNVLAGSLVRVNAGSQKRDAGAVSCTQAVTGTQTSPALETQLTEQSPLLLSEHRLCVFSL